MLTSRPSSVDRGFSTIGRTISCRRSSVAATDAIRSLLREALAERAIDEEALDREALVLFTLIEGFSFSSTLLPAPLLEADVRAGVTATVHRLQDAYPLSGPHAGKAREGSSVVAGAPDER